MPKLSETPAQKRERLTNRFGYHACTFCHYHFPAVDYDTGKPIPKSTYMKPKFAVTVGSFRFAAANVCFDCIQLTTTKIVEVIIRKMEE